jgi:aminoglycoside/choline kinase family phosphotransferase
MASDELEWIRRATGATSARRLERVQSLWSGYGEIFRVELTDSDTGTAIVKSVQPPARERGKKPSVSHSRKCRSYDVEMRFYRDHSSRTNAGCRVPKLIHAESGNERWLFLLEDLDGAGYSERRRSLDRGETERCLSWLARFHAEFLGTKPEGLWRSGTYWHLATRKEELAAMQHDALREAAPLLDRKLNEAKFQTLVHGDAKVANFCFSKRGGDVAAVDFQYVGGGVGMKDVGYLLSDSPSPHPERAEQRFLDHYFQELGRALTGRGVDLEALESEWRALYPIACADFYRFLAGWAKHHFDHDTQAQRVTQQVLATLA